MNSLNEITQPMFKLDSLRCIRVGTPKEASDVNAVVDMMLDPAGEGIKNDDYWLKSSETLLAGMITHVLHDCTIDETQKTMGMVVRLLSNTSESFFGTLEASPHAAVVRAARLRHAPYNTRQGVVCTVMSRVTVPNATA